MHRSLSARGGLQIIAILLGFILTCFPGSTAASTQKVLLVPFTIYSEKDLSFLQKGIQSMLATRLARDQSLDVVELKPADPALGALSGAVDEASAATLAGRFSTDYVAFGTVTILGESISTDARFYDAAAGETKVAYSNAGKTQGDAILHVNAFAAKVNAEVFGKGDDGSRASKRSGPGGIGAFLPERSREALASSVRHGGFGNPYGYRTVGPAVEKR